MPDDTPAPIAWPSVNACRDSVDMTVSWSDGRPGSPPAKMMVLRMSWEEIIALVEERGTEIDADLQSLVDAVGEFADKDS